MKNQPPLTTLLVTDEEAAQFLLFQRHYELFKNMQEKGIFEIEYGKCTLNFAFGSLQNIIKEEIVYHKPTAIKL